MLEGKPVSGPVGDYDLQVTLAERYHWAPAQVMALDPDFVEELAARMRAEAAVQKEKDRRANRKARHARPQERGMIVEDVGIEEIN